MAGAPIALLVEGIHPSSGRGWHGGPTPLGALRGVRAEQARWKPTRRRKSIWTLTLHIAYWNYAVRRLLDGSKRGAFPRGPANWPELPQRLDESSWAADIALLRQEHERLLAAASAVDPGLLDRRPQTSRRWTYGELLLGVAMHDAYHTGQIQLLKRLWHER
jgi:uncharacterized damage-inducible protein DinB